MVQMYKGMGLTQWFGCNMDETPVQTEWLASWTPRKTYSSMRYLELDMDEVTVSEWDSPVLTCKRKLNFDEVSEPFQHLPIPSPLFLPAPCKA